MPDSPRIPRPARPNDEQGGLPLDHPELTAAMRAALDELRRQPDVRYAEVRYVDETAEKLLVRDGRPERVTSSGSSGLAVRVLAARAWGFACTAEVRESTAVDAARRALSIARASAAVAHAAIVFPDHIGVVGRYETPIEQDPFAVSLDEKLAALDRPVRALLAGGRPVRSAEAWMEWTRTNKRLVTTEGTDVSQSFVYGSHGMHAVAVDDHGHSQKRSYPTFHGGDGFQGGYENIRALDLLGEVDRVRDEATALLTAPPCPAGERALILESSQMGLQIHESCGHPTELDRALGSEISLAGGSFLQPGMLGRFRYGSDIVTLVADSTAEGGMGTFGWDDEGVAAGKHPLVERGVFVDYLSGRESAASIGKASTGTMRADGWNRPPLIRMVNVSLEPGRGSLDDLFADTDDGVFMATDRSWSIDDLRLNFQFSCEIAWEIKKGKRTRILRDPIYTGITPGFWGACDAICGPEEFRLWGIGTCGKGDPMQTMKVGHGASPARFRSVRVGNSGGAA
jgi:TldD protein